MVELLCVLVIISSLGTSAIGQMVDFRNEGRAAAVRSALNTIRAGIRNQRQQALLKCGYERICVLENEWSRLVGALSLNDITSPFVSIPALSLPGRRGAGAVCGNPTPFRLPGSPPPPATPAICTIEQVSSEADRRFFAPGASGARVYSGISALPDNPFISQDSVVNAVALRHVYRNRGQTNCELVDEANALTSVVNGNTVPQVTHWIYLTDRDEIIAGTNTPGIRECDF